MFIEFLRLFHRTQDAENLDKILMYFFFEYFNE